MKEQDKQAPVVHNTFNAPIGQYVQYQHIEHMTIGSDGQIHVASSSQSTPEPTPSIQYSQFLKRGANPLKSDDEVQQNFVNAAKSGPSALVDYLLSAEGKLYFDISNIKPSVLINTINQECGTNIKLKSYQTALQRKM
jgi:hypothetical protein